ncbi:anti-adapter protein IraP [Erwiniaceae bacterium CAU 1747]
MKNLIAELLVRLAEKETESKELVAQVEALEIVVTTLLRKIDAEQLRQINESIDSAFQNASGGAQQHPEDLTLLQSYIQRLLNHPRQ